MKTKTITKTFYVSGAFIDDLKDENLVMSCKCIYTDKAETRPKNKIQISWLEPEKKIEISESKFDELIKDIKVIHYTDGLCSLKEHIKERFFGCEEL